MPRAASVRAGPAIICLVAASVVAACAGAVASPSSGTPRPVLTPVPVFSAPDDVTPSAADAASAGGSLGPGESPGASASGLASAAAACTGTDANRLFLATAASKVQWDLYCAILPKGWSVDAGSYRATSGGWLKIAYKASGGRRYELREGAFCADPATCLPTGTELGPGQFADREATVLQVAGGGYAAIVDKGDPIMWAAIGTAIDETTFRSFTAALGLVSDEAP